MSAVPTVRRSRVGVALAATVVAAAGVVWLVRHALSLTSGETHSLTALWLVTSAALIWMLVTAWLERPYTVTPEEQAELDKLVVAVALPTYNEDPAVTREVLKALLVQTRKPDRVMVVDDGSTVDYSDVERWWLQEAKAHGIEGSWKRTANQGKRHAQLEMFRPENADVFATMDSDTLLAPDCLEKAMFPLKKPRIKSVAALVVALNAKANLLTRLSDLHFLNFQLINRAGLSTLKSVLVNSGCFALYRAQVVHDCLDAYANETFMGRHVPMSDDSMLTLQALLHKRTWRNWLQRPQTVQQPNAYSFTMLPEKTGHHLRQQLRWFRGSTIRSIWRFKHLPMLSYAWWYNLSTWVGFAAFSTVAAYLVVYQPTIDGRLPLMALAISVAVCYLTSLKYLTLQRSDLSFKWQLGTFVLSPIILVWNMAVLRPLRFYAIATCARTGNWGTRQDGVEVGLEKVEVAA